MMNPMYKQVRQEEVQLRRDILFWLASPLTALLLPSLYIGALYFSGVIQLSWPLEDPMSMFYFGSGIVAMLIVSWLTIALSTNRSAKPVSTNSVIARWHRLWLPFAILAFMAMIVTLADFALTMNYSSLDLFAIRRSFADREATMLAYVSNLLTPFSLMLLGLTLVLFEQLTPTKRLIGLGMGIGVPMLISLGLGGRSQIVDLIILVPWWLLQRPLLGKPLFPGKLSGFLMGLSVFAVAVWFLAVVSVSRSFAGEMQFAEVLYYNTNTVSLSPDITNFLYESDPTLATGLSEALFYWSSSIAAFDILYSHWQLESDLFRSISPVLYRRLAVLGLPSQEQISDEQKYILRSFNVPPNMFYTATFGLISSFGRVGAFLVQMLLAFIAGRAYVQARRKVSFTYMYLSSLFYLMFFLWFQSFLTSYPIHEYGFYWCILFILIERFKWPSLTRSRTAAIHN
jgi:oligosaccharide repeat unit polymerase